MKRPKLGPDFHVKESACTNCGHSMNGALAVGDDQAPVPGDVTLCIRCGHLMAFADDLTLRELTAAEAVDIAGDPILVGASEALAKVIRKARQ